MDGAPFSSMPSTSPSTSRARHRRGDYRRSLGGGALEAALPLRYAAEPAAGVHSPEPGCREWARRSCCPAHRGLDAVYARIAVARAAEVEAPPAVLCSARLRPLRPDGPALSRELAARMARQYSAPVAVESDADEAALLSRWAAESELAARFGGSCRAICGRCASARSSGTVHRCGLKVSTGLSEADPDLRVPEAGTGQRTAGSKVVAACAARRPSRRSVGFSARFERCPAIAGTAPGIR